MYWTYSECGPNSQRQPALLLNSACAWTRSISSRLGSLSSFRVFKKTTILQKDIVVFIVGPSGSGKSWLFSILLQIANTHVPLGEGQALGFTEVNAERCRFDGEDSDIILVDAPSLWTSAGMSQQTRLREWLDLKY
ncbi:hypothetical protein PISMIDRAFT_683941 [Pisolithus microcarpus 441]|uniref:Uncharacterized protein n=1 Tax=Pisolithus microcarpus 441 TaxID=765257 RepID=A0A0C9YQ59_9AGAM|nr:hypothetical protein PISMIDRAFT_683941 [Pisolithus microcarpus 441]